MHTKKVAIIITLCALSILQAGVLGKLDFFGFLDGRHQISLSLFILSLLIGYLSSITVFLLEFSQRHRLWAVFVGCALLFTTTFFVVNGALVVSGVIGLLYAVYLYITHSTAHKRAKLYIKFNPSEILAPVVRNSFAFMLALFACINFFTAQSLVSTNALFAPRTVRPLTKPVTQIINRELTNQIRKELAAKLPENTPVAERRKIIYFILNDTVNTLAIQGEGRVFGVPRKAIHTEKAIVHTDGSIDLAPVVDEIVPEISVQLNAQVRKYYLIAPFILALLTYIFLQPIFYLLNVIEIPLTKLVFFILFRSRFLHVKKEMREVDSISL